MIPQLSKYVKYYEKYTSLKLFLNLEIFLQILMANRPMAFIAYFFPFLFSYLNNKL